MWDSVFKFIVKRTSVEPNYTKENCIAFKQGLTSCHICKDVCPHEAISFQRGKEVKIDDIDCTGCGICVQSCPSQALEAKLNYQVGAPIKCSQVKGGAQTIQCLGRLGPSDLLRLAGTKNKATLIRNDCANCKIGTEAVLENLQKNEEKAQLLAQLKNRDFSLDIQIHDSYDAIDNPEVLSRRDLLRGGFKGLQNTAAEALAPFDPGGNDETKLPREMQRQYRMIASSKPEPEQLVPWILPRVGEKCILCPICTKICPTQAFSRTFNVAEKGGTVLNLEPEKCNGCAACVRACPVKTISLDEDISWQELSGGLQEVFFKAPRKSDDDKDGTVSR
ncbi:MAG: 4Fe-4S dicluster domain-containing protein [Trueperaceae bacterium]|nr:4Fe-4S dicluster domain-containing protein [Trueperaceae bacterium]